MRDFHFSIDRGGTFTDVFAQVGAPSLGATGSGARSGQTRAASR